LHCRNTSKQRRTALFEPPPTDLACHA